MLTRTQNGPRQKVGKPPNRKGEWCRTNVRTAAETIRVTEAVVAAMAAAGFPETDRFAVRLALEEAVVNGVKHGHHGDATKRVRVRYHISPERVLAEVEDQGPGFDPHQVPNPCDDDRLDKPSGRGLLLMRSYLTWLRFNERGNRVTLCKRRSQPPPG
jgi:serine/threonine-protein kinase RsbW